jgi:adenylate cyclase
VRALAPRRRTSRRVDWLRAIALGLLVGGGGAAFVASPPGLAFEETLGLSWLFLVRGPIEPPPEVAVVSLDKGSADALGLPPQPRRWPRTLQAEAIGAIDRAGASAIAVDLILSERSDLAQDAALATAIAEAGRVVLFQQLERRRETLTIGAANFGEGLWSERTRPPLREFAAAAAASAPFPLPKVGAGVRQFWTFKREAGDAPTLPAVALQLHALAAYQQWINALEAEEVLAIGEVPFLAGGLGGSLAEAMTAMRGVYRSRADLGEAVAAARPEPGSHADPTARQQADPELIDAIAGLYTGPDSRYLNFYGPAGTVPIIPVARLLAAKAPAEAKLDLAGKVVFLGVAELDDPGQPDGFYSVFTRPDGVDLSGVEIAATAFANMLTDRPIKPASVIAAAALAGGIGLAAGVAAALLPALVVVPSTIAAASLYALAAQAAFNRTELWLPLATPLLLQLPLALFLGVLGQYILVQRQRRRMTQAISYYLPEKVAADLSDGALTAPGDRGETVHATCLATDLENFTAIAETMTPEAVARYLNAYFAAIAEPIKRHGADVLEFRADGVMCAWTGATPQEASEGKACEAALGVMAAARNFGAGQHRPVPTRIGIHAGRIFVGHAGGGGRYAYSIIGDIANTASRIEGLNKLIGTSLLVSDAVAARLHGFVLRPVGRFRLRGKLAPIGIVEVLARRREATQEMISLCERFAAALAEYQGERWGEAAAAFAALAADHPDDAPSAFYSDRCRLLAETPPDHVEPGVIRVDAK